MALCNRHEEMVLAILSKIREELFCGDCGELIRQKLSHYQASLDFLHSVHSDAEYAAVWRC